MIFYRLVVANVITQTGAKYQPGIYGFITTKFKITITQLTDVVC